MSTLASSYTGLSEMDKPSDFVPRGRMKVIESGDATVPESAGLRYILQFCDNQGQGEDDFSRKLASRWPGVETSYRNWYRNSFGKWEGGEIKTVQVQSDTVVVHMVAMLLRKGGKKPKLDKDALRKCLDAVGKEASYNNGTVHLSKTGTSKDWKVIEDLLTEQLLRRGLNVTVYDASK